MGGCGSTSADAVDQKTQPQVLYGGKPTPGRLTFTPGVKPRIMSEIDLSAISSNTSEIQKRAKQSGCHLVGIVKGDAYGHGSVAVAHMLVARNGVDFFGVATLEEALELRESGLPLNVRVLVLGASHASEWPVYARHRLDLMINSEESADALVSWCSRQTALPHAIRAHVMLDTGMGRIGLDAIDEINEYTDVLAYGSTGNQQSYHGVNPDAVEAAKVIKRIADADNGALEFAAICTHMSDAKEGSSYTTKQFERVKQVVEAVRSLGVRVPMLHLENTESLLSDKIPDDDFKALLKGNPGNGADTIGYARSGGGLYGLRAFDFLRTCLTVKVQIRHIHVVQKGLPVGYDRSWTATEDCVIATIAAGFADGLSFENSNVGDDAKAGLSGRSGRGQVFVNGRMCDIAGKVCMDMTMVNLGPGTIDDIGVKVGDYVTVYGGESGRTSRDYAAVLGNPNSDVTIDFALRRVKRTYVNPPIALCRST